jgi:molybdopterin synthase catalytic subunit/molybdopterin converting factor small subunit
MLSTSRTSKLSSTRGSSSVRIRRRGRRRIRRHEGLNLPRMRRNRTSDGLDRLRIRTCQFSKGNWHFRFRKASNGAVALHYWQARGSSGDWNFMEVRILFFGVLKDLAGRGSDLLNLPEDTTLRDVFIHYEKSIPRLSDLAASIAISINQEFAGLDAKLKGGDEIAFLPPVSGGLKDPPSDKPARGRGYSSIVRDRISTQTVLGELKQPSDGAAIVFEGVVRDHTRGRRTLYLHYEAYEEMALKQMDVLAEQALQQFSIRDVVMVHRLGRLEIGETSVLIVVASAHRAAAFDACRWLIDTLKRTVPIWKKEYFEDGAVWADGESFPSEIPRVEGSHSERPASK